MLEAYASSGASKIENLFSGKDPYFHRYSIRRGPAESSSGESPKIPYMSERKPLSAVKKWKSDALRSV